MGPPGRAFRQEPGQAYRSTSPSMKEYNSRRSFSSGGEPKIQPDGLPVRHKRSRSRLADQGRVVPLSGPMTESFSLVDPDELEGLFAYSNLTMHFSDPTTREDFNKYLLPYRTVLIRYMSLICMVLGVAILGCVNRATDRGEAGQARAAIVRGLLLLWGGAVALGLSIRPARVMERYGHVLGPALHTWLMIICMWTLYNTTHSEVPDLGESYYTLVVFGLLLLHLMVLFGTSIHAPLPLIAAMDALLFLQLVDVNAVFDEASDELVVLSSLTIFIILLAMSITTLRKNCQTFVYFCQVQRTKDGQVRHRIREEAERQKRDYVAQTLHDVGTPLATFALAIENMKTSAPVNQEHLEILRTCECAIELMTLTRRKAIDYAKYSTGKDIRPRLGSTNVRDLVETKCKRIMSGFNSASPVPIEYNVDPSIAKYIVTDGEFIWECLVNYLSNAVKFTNEGLIQCNLFKITPDRIRFEVRDTGIGIPHERKQQLFRPFTQLQKFAGGTGLGLWSVKQKVISLKGEVGIHDNPGGGTVFFFDVPYKPDYVLESAMEDMQVARGGTLGAHLDTGAEGTVKRVLLVDSRASTHDVAQTLLETHGFQVHHATNGFEGLAKMQNLTYTAVLIDYHVTVMDALQVVQKFRDWEESVSANRHGDKQFICVMFAGTPPEVELNAAINSGADAVWTDPLIPDTNDIVMMLEDERQQREGKRTELSPISSPGAPASPLGKPGGVDGPEGPPGVGPPPGPPKRRNSRTCMGVVLLVEDELSILKFEQKMFERHGFEVYTATNGEDGLQRMKERMYAAVFTDIMMPIMDGYETVRRFRQWEEQQGPTVRPERQLVYAVSANASEQDHEMAHMIGMDGFASKPVKVKELVELVKRRRIAT